MAEATEPKIQLRLLGAPQLLIDGTAASIGSRKAMALLAHLADHPAARTRFLERYPALASDRV